MNLFQPGGRGNIFLYVIVIQILSVLSLSIEAANKNTKLVSTVKGTCNVCTCLVTSALRPLGHSPNSYWMAINSVSVDQGWIQAIERAVKVLVPYFIAGWGFFDEMLLVGKYQPMKTKLFIGTYQFSQNFCGEEFLVRLLHGTCGRNPLNS